MRVSGRTASRLSIVATIVAIAAGGCGDDARPIAIPPAVGDVQHITDAAQISMPLDRHQMTRQEDLLLQRAEWRLAVDCMARFGVQYDSPAELYPAMSVVNHERLYGVLDLKRAAAWGYLGEDPAKRRAAEERAERLQTVVPEPIQDLLGGPTDPTAASAAGIPEDGCMGEARRELAAGHDAVDEHVILDMAMVAGQHAQKDERVRAAFASWSACMSRAGFNYNEPWDPNNHPWPRDNDTITEQERVVATTDVKCKHEMNVVGVWHAVDSAYQSHLIERHAQLLAALKQSRAGRLERAASVMAVPRP